MIILHKHSISYYHSNGKLLIREFEVLVVREWNTILIQPPLIIIFKGSAEINMTRSTSKGPKVPDIFICGMNRCGKSSSGRNEHVRYSNDFIFKLITDCTVVQ